MSCRRSPSCRARTPFSMASSCSRPATRKSSTIARCSRASACAARRPRRRRPVQLEHGALARQLAALDAAQQRRRLRIIDAGQVPADPVRVRIDGRELLNFSSNDYLSLRTHPALVEAAHAAMMHYGLGAGAAHLITGHSREHHALEEELADFTGRERALLFSTGYMANLGVLAALAGRHDIVLADRLNHASLLDAVRLAGARPKRYRHADAADARRALSEDTCLI